MDVADLLATKGPEVATISRGATMRAVVAELARRRIGALVVSPDGRRIDGIISERDVVRGLSELGPEFLAEPASAHMSSTVETCTPGDSVVSLMNLMTERRIRHVPVVEDGHLCGIISIGDVVKSRIGELEKDRDELMEYITAR